MLNKLTFAFLIMPILMITGCGGSNNNTSNKSTTAGVKPEIKQPAPNNTDSTDKKNPNNKDNQTESNQEKEVEKDYFVRVYSHFFQTAVVEIDFDQNNTIEENETSPVAQQVAAFKYTTNGALEALKNNFIQVQFSQPNDSVDADYIQHMTLFANPGKQLVTPLTTFQVLQTSLATDKSFAFPEEFSLMLDVDYIALIKQAKADLVTALTARDTVRIEALRKQLDQAQLLQAIAMNIELNLSEADILILKSNHLERYEPLFIKMKMIGDAVIHKAAELKADPLRNVDYSNIYARFINPSNIITKMIDTDDLDDFQSQINAWANRYHLDTETLNTKQLSEFTLSNAQSLTENLVNYPIEAFEFEMINTIAEKMQVVYQERPGRLAPVFTPISPEDQAPILSELSHKAKTWICGSDCQTQALKAYRDEDLIIFMNQHRDMLIIEFHNTNDQLIYFAKTCIEDKPENCPTGLIEDQYLITREDFTWHVPVHDNIEPFEAYAAQVVGQLDYTVNLKVNFKETSSALEKVVFTQTQNVPANQGLSIQYKLTETFADVMVLEGSTIRAAVMKYQQGTHDIHHRYYDSLDFDARYFADKHQINLLNIHFFDRAKRFGVRIFTQNEDTLTQRFPILFGHKRLGEVFVEDGVYKISYTGYQEPLFSQE
ncbi:hypothetical protein [Algicola sagamiensis]|uniref:hypothetical protein n=1 Tax=Algicola sagamiensis TaxID=163869 RepID=UPI00037F554F|nr:hypothetical protein [Algicola sagamiensis]